MRKISCCNNLPREAEDSSALDTSKIHLNRVLGCLVPERLDQMIPEVPSKLVFQDLLHNLSFTTGSTPWEPARAGAIRETLSMTPSQPLSPEVPYPANSLLHRDCDICPSQLHGRMLGRLSMPREAWTASWRRQDTWCGTCPVGSSKNGVISNRHCSC